MRLFGRRFLRLENDVEDARSGRRYSGVHIIETKIKRMFDSYRSIRVRNIYHETNSQEDGRDPLVDGICCFGVYRMN